VAVLPNFSDWLASFVRGVMGVSTAVLSDINPALQFSYDIAVSIVLKDLQGIPVGSAGASIYSVAVYNLAASNLVNFAQDVANAPNVAGSDPPAPYFANLRNKWNIAGYVSGTISGASDEGTSETMVVPKAAEDFTLADLQYTKDPFGRQYLALAQRYGSLWGLT
jgi:hypothetical protein